MKKKMRIFPSTRLLLAILLIASAFFSNFASQLPDDEVKALREIKESLGKTNGWDFNVDPCSGQGGWKESDDDNNINCTCSTLTNGTSICHVQRIILKRQNLPGVLPPQLFKLPSLVEFDVTGNYLNGTIPSQWGSTRLVNISLLGNRLTGSIPREIGNITSLVSLVVECNQLSGSLPPELGNLTRIERLLLSSNNFTGELPPTLANLTTLKDFRIPDNNFTGKIPNFIENWTNLEKLVIQSSGLQGPIPDGIALLQKVTDLRITDLNGPEARFPPLDNMTSLETLILRSCNLSGPLPGYFRGMTVLETLDLSFNKLSGTIPNNFIGPSIRYMYLTGNLFTGPVPDLSEIINKVKAIDFSYNNFTSGYSSCQEQKMNLFGRSLESNQPGNLSCLRNSMECPQMRYGFYINCGGDETTIGDITYDADISDLGGAATFSLSGANKWGLSSTGNFIDDGSDADTYTTKNKSILVMNNPNLYMSARLSPVSLTYFGFCLGNGKYKVNLHFAEIIFTDDQTYASLGRRIFDVYVQGELVLPDFNIEEEAGGIGKEVIKPFHAYVSSNTLEIRFYWKGRGTTFLPVKGVYGPLISAIYVKSDFNPPTDISTGAVIGIVAAVAFVIILILGIVLWWKSCLWCKDRMEHDLKNLDLHTGSFTLRQIKAATNNFDAANKIGEGGFGSVYKGLLLDGTTIAVKQLSSKSKQGNREFVNEIGMISALQHPHLVKLYGCCIEGHQLLLVYEYMENNCLARALFGPEECQLELNWATRHKICVGIARGLAYLHEESRLKIVHRDIKATNVLLDKNFNPKISDFGLAKLDEEDSTHISTRIAGTYGYMAPEYAMRGYLTDKADVYSFGIVALEIVSGRSNVISKTKEKSIYLLDWVLVLKEKGNLMELVDPRLGSDFNKEEVMTMINVAIRCTNVSPAVRPSMSSVVSMLEGRSIVGELISDPSDDMETNNHLQDIQEHNMSETQGLIKSMSIDGRWTTSTSVSDLYPINLDSHYLEKRE